MSEAMGPVEHLIAKGPISKYATGEPAVRQGPIPELLKNYMDVGVWGSGRQPGAGECGLTAHSAAGRSWLSGNVLSRMWVLVKSLFSASSGLRARRVGGRASTQTPL